MDRIPGCQRAVFRWTYLVARAEARTDRLSSFGKTFNDFRKPESQVTAHLDKGDFVSAHPIIDRPNRHLQLSPEFFGSEQTQAVGCSGGIHTPSTISLSVFK